MQDTVFNIQFSINYICKYGYSVYLLGDHHGLGSWNPKRALRLEWNKNDNWSLAVELVTSTPCPKYIQYKYVVGPTTGLTEETVIWEEGPNRAVNLFTLSNNSHQTIDTWGYRRVRLTLNDMFTKNTNIKHYRPVVTGKILDIIGIKGPLKMELQEMRVITKKRSEREEARWTTTFLVHHSVSQFEYRYTLLDRCQNKFHLNRKVSKRFSNPLFSGLATFNLTTSYQVLGGMVTKIDHVAYEEFIFDKILPNVILGSSLNNRYEVELLQKEGVTHVMDVQTAADITEHCSDHNAVISALRDFKIEYTHNPVEERNTRKLKKGCRDACEVLKDLLDSSKIVYLHCTYGALRSVHTLLSYLVIYKKVSTTQAIEFVKHKRKVALPSKELLSDIIKIEVQKQHREKAVVNLLLYSQFERPISVF